MKNNQQLTDRQQRLSAQIQKAGQLTEISFVKNILSLEKIRDASDENVTQGFMFLFTRIPNLLGIKETISDINKNDIIEMILSRFNGLSLIEIDYAFKLERYAAYDIKTGHYQLFNAEYVAAILKKYKNWVSTIRKINNLPMKNPEPVIEISDQEKENIELEGCLHAFEDYRQTARLDPGRIYTYNVLYYLGLLPVHTKDFKAKIYQRAKDKALERAKTIKQEARGDKIKRTESQRIIDRINSGEEDGILKNALKEIVLKYFFRSLIINGKELKHLLFNNKKL